MSATKILLRLCTGGTDGKTRIKNTSRPPPIPDASLTPTNVIETTWIIDRQCTHKFVQIITPIVWYTLGCLIKCVCFDQYDIIQQITIIDDPILFLTLITYHKTNLLLVLPVMEDLNNKYAIRHHNLRTTTNSHDHYLVYISHNLLLVPVENFRR